MEISPEQLALKIQNTSGILMRLIVERSTDVLWYSDLDHPENDWITDSFWDSVGYHPADFSSIDEAVSLSVFKEDLPDKENLEHLDDTLIRFKHQTGRIIWFSCKATVERNSNGEIRKLIRVLHNISELKKKEKFLEQCNATAQIGYWEIDLINSSYYWSPITRKIHEVPDNYEVDIVKSLDFFTERDKQIVNGAYLEAIETGRPFNIKCQIKTWNEKELWIRIIGNPEIVDGRCIQMYGTVQDIDELERSTQQNKEARERLQLATSTSEIGIWEFNLSSFEVIWDEMMHLFYDLPKDSPITFRKWTSCLHPEDKTRVEKELLNVIRYGEDLETEYRVPLRNGTLRYISATAHVQRDENGQPYKLLGTNHDITQSKLAEIELKNSNSRNQAFVEQAPTAIAMFDKDMKYIAVSHKWISDYGLEGQTLIGRSHYEVFPEIGDIWKAHHQACLEGATLRKEEDKFVRANGDVQWLKWEDKPWYNDQGEIGGIIMFTEDITSKKRTEEQLQISEQAFRSNFENAAIGMAMLNAKGDWIRVNQKVCDIVGYSEEELLGLTYLDITHPEDWENDIHLIRQLSNGEIPYYQTEKRYIHKSGAIVNIIIAASVVRNQEGEILYYITQIIDITQQKIAQQKLAEALAANQGILDASTQVSIVSTDKNGIIKSFNKGAENLMGFTASEAINILSPALFHDFDEVMNFQKELSEKVGREMDPFDCLTYYTKDGGTFTREWTHIRKDGSRFPVQLTISAMQMNGETTGYLGIAVDISELKQAEKEIQSLLELAQDQNARLKNFAHIVSHNLKSHSGNIEFLLDLLIQESPEFEENDTLSFIRKASRSLAETISNLNEVAMINASGTEETEKIQLRSVVNKALDAVSALALKSNVTINTNIPDEVFVEGVHAYLDSIVLNMLTNGIKYKQDGIEGHIHISVEDEGEFWKVNFEDNGLGIDLNQHGAKLFGLYKTFHRNKESKGVGLFITKNQIEAMGGKIEVKSIVMKGSIFSIHLKKA